MHTNSDSENSRPVTPSDEDCCHSTCDPCIFDVHKKLLEEYEKKKKQNIKTKSKNNILCLSSYTTFVVNNIRKVSENYILLALKYQEDEIRKDISLLIDPGQYVMLHSWNLTRPFTPISWTDRSIEFLIKLYPDGKFSTLLKNTKVGDKINVRGPYGDFIYKCNSFQQIIMFSIGSGIAAVYSIAKAIIDNELEETKVYLIGGFQRVTQIPLKKELQNLSDYWNFKCTLYISQPLDDTCNLHGISIKPNRLNKQSVLKILQNNAPDTTLILICGTHQFNTSVEEWTRDMNYSHVYVFK